MANNYGNPGAYPYPWAGQSSDTRPDLRHKVSAMDPLDTFYSDPNRPDLKHKVSAMDPLDAYQAGNRDSIVSLPSPVEEVDISRVRISDNGHAGRASPTPSARGYGNGGLPETLRVGTPTTPSGRGFSNPFRNSGTSYAPVATAAESPTKPNRLQSKRLSKRRGSLLSMSQGSIPEGDEINMNLLGGAMPMGIRHKTSYAAVEEEDPDSIEFDVSSYSGPSFFGAPKTEEQVKEGNKAEAAGILTGGLGAGWKPDTIIKSKDLLATSPMSPQGSRHGHPTRMNRGISIRTGSFGRPGLGRTPTVRELGQIEANKRGEIIEVIVEEPTVDVDITSFSGGTTASKDFDRLTSAGTSRRGTMGIPTITEVFFPQANWKPFSMRWPYLTVLIICSVVLAAAQEYLCQKKTLYKFETAQHLSTWSYFTFKYLPTLIAVSFGVLWQVTDFEVKRLEPYYQLSKPGGALAAESINVDYITFFNMLRPLQALRFKHYAVAVSSLATLVAVSLVPTLQAASIELWPDHDYREKHPTDAKEIRINPIYSRFLSALLILVAIMGSVLIWQLERRPSGLVADVKGVAGIAAMANKSHILMDFKNMDTASPKMIHQTLKTHRYSLRNSSLAPEDQVLLTQKEKDKYDQTARPENPHPLMLRLIAGVPFIIGMVLFLCFVPIVLFNPTANIITEKIPWLLTLLAVFIKLAWGTLETDVRMIEPFYILSRRHASPKVLTLDYTAMAFGWMPIRAFLNGHVLIGLVGLGSVLAEVLTICMTSFVNVSGLDFLHDKGSGDFDRRDQHSPPDRADGVNAGEETFLSFWLSFGAAVGIICFLCLVAVLVYVRRRHPFLPRQPNTIASVLAFIHQSKMLYDFVGTEKMNNDEMVERLGGLGKKYGLGWFVGRDGDVHCGVDEEELVSNYKHGDDARKASQPWNSDWENF